MTNKMLHDLMEEYIESLPDYDEDDWFVSTMYVGWWGLSGFVEWLQKKGYRIESLKERF